MVYFPLFCFSAFRFHGLTVPTANNSLWFYSIQGLFRVAFEFYSKQDQLAVLENFQDVWKSQINDSPLNMSYCLSTQLDLAVTSSMTERGDAKSKDGLTQHTQCCQIGGELAVTCEGGPGNTSGDHDYCSVSMETSHNHNQLLSTVRHKLHNLGDKLSSKCPDNTEHLETILLLLESIDQYIHRTVEETDVTDMVLALLRAKQRGSVYSSHLLNSIGQWLGQQFHAANVSISQKVEGFKVQHIERISDLPPAEELAAELFPDAMRTLLLHWMGLSEESSLEKRHSEYPILLLILEFANHNLITGVAHVLYSSLICK
ncbi:uncharacterized protein LOC143001345 isoform X2 [Genypterus blacodes]|uniref:uncharacterized protein LOC143001345 isoform X2 n=1 Tax=Genypterus blacodes TaxID=154954 RepID=UPI003F76B81B